MLIYSHPNLYQVVNVQNLLALHHLTTQIRNQYAAGGAGDLSPIDTWVELWLVDAQDEDQAKALIEQMQVDAGSEWFCSSCGEKNTGAFDFCWSCQALPDTEG